MTDIIWIFWIFKWPIFVILLCGCSQVLINQGEAQKDFIAPSHQEVLVPRVVLPIGPSNSGALGPFQNKTSLYGLEGVQATHLYSVDLNNDGHDDLVFLPNHYSIPAFMIFNPIYARFESIQTPVFDSVIRASFLNFADLNHDGIWDVLAGVFHQKGQLVKESVRIFQGFFENGTYRLKEVQAALNPSLGPGPVSSAIFFDYDLDGHLDLFVSQWYDQNGPKIVPIKDRLFKGNGFQFTDVSYLLTQEYGQGGKAFPSFGATACDVDLNGYPDIVTTSTSGLPNRLWMNTTQTNQRLFMDYGPSSGVAQDELGKLLPKSGGNTQVALCTDYNNDKIMDLFLGELTHSHDPATKDRSSFLTGSQFYFPPEFIRSEYYLDDGTLNWTQADQSGVFLDYNMDGAIDLVVANTGFPPKSRMIFFEQMADHSFIDQAKQWGMDLVNPSGPIGIDANRDGFVDVLVGQSNVRMPDQKTSIYLFENQIKNHHRRLRLRLRGTRANHFGLGATVIVKSDSMSQTRFHNLSYGPQPSGSTEGVFFGLGPKDQNVLIRVIWPIKDHKISQALLVEYPPLKVDKEFVDLILKEDGTFEYFY